MQLAHWFKQRFSVTLARLVSELQGESTLALNEIQTKKQIISSRSFGRPVTDYKEMEQALITHTANAARKLRQQNSACHYLTLYFHTNPFDSKMPAYRPNITLPLNPPTNNPILLAKVAKQGLAKIWRSGLSYHKAGVVVSDIVSDQTYQLDLFQPSLEIANQQKLDKVITVLDQLNHRMGKHTLYLLSEGLKTRTAWQMNRNFQSPRYTTRWNELLKV